MIRTPAQIKLMAMGLPHTPCNVGGESSSSSASTNTTNTTTNTTYQDRRNVADGGSTVVSADQSSVFITNSDGGAIKAGVDLGTKAMDTSLALTQAGQSMLDHNIQLTRDLSSGSNSLARDLFANTQNAVESAMAQNQSALQVVQALAAQPGKLNDPNRAILLVGMTVVAIAAVVMVHKG
ncbi:hypothetical protein [Ralstonia pickettii]|uniref:hypothetical protein n=1 Tax=Ralstonia pickettii TaxID=329 RepID=UPI0008188992|nr:hypothetical protein [Ralstonia pickettii]OCS48838.1 hypothetical protein BEK67_19665 [Ralstonia pickettii]